MANSKIVYFGKVLMDLTKDTVVADKLLTGYTAHDKSGEEIVGTCDFDVNSQDATVNPAEILKDKTAYDRGVKLTGTMPNNAAVSGTISTKDGVYTVPQGYHDGSGKVQIDDVEKAKIIAENIITELIMQTSNVIFQSLLYAVNSNKIAANPHRELQIVRKLGIYFSNFACDFRI
jgi:hypothetical protein